MSESGEWTTDETFLKDAELWRLRGFLETVRMTLGYDDGVGPETMAKDVARLKSRCPGETHVPQVCDTVMLYERETHKAYSGSITRCGTLGVTLRVTDESGDQPWEEFWPWTSVLSVRVEEET